MIVRAPESRGMGLFLGALGLWFIAALAYHLLAAKEQSAKPGDLIHRPSISEPAEPLPLPPPTLVAPPVIPAHLKPGYNFALAERGAKATGGVRPQDLIDGNSSIYSGGDGFGYTQFPAHPQQSMLIELKNAPTINCVRFLLWDMDDRFYRYKLELSNDPAGTNWTLAVDKSKKDDASMSWQVIRFPDQPVKFIKLTGTYNSSNSGFHVVEIQACIFPPGGFEKDRPSKSLQPIKPVLEEELVF